MNEKLSNLKDEIEHCLRLMCGALSPGWRLTVILGLCILLGALNLYITVRAIYNIGRKDAKRELIEIPQKDFQQNTSPSNNYKMNSQDE